MERTKDRPQIRVSEQYPKVIQDKRKQLSEGQTRW